MNCNLHESKLLFVSRIELIRSKLSNFSAHVSGVTVRPEGRTAGQRTAQTAASGFKPALGRGGRGEVSTRLGRGWERIGRARERAGREAGSWEAVGRLRIDRPAVGRRHQPAGSPADGRYCLPTRVPPPGPRRGTSRAWVVTAAAPGRGEEDGGDTGSGAAPDVAAEKGVGLGSHHAIDWPPVARFSQSLACRALEIGERKKLATSRNCKQMHSSSAILRLIR